MKGRYSDLRISHTQHKGLTPIGGPDVLEIVRSPISFVKEHWDPDRVSGGACSVEEEDSAVGVDFTLKESDVALDRH